MAGSFEHDLPFLVFRFSASEYGALVLLFYGGD